MTRPGFRAAAALLLAAMGAAQLTSALQETQTWDEAIHQTAGLVYLKTGHLYFFTDHPPLRTLFAVPLLFLHPRLPLDGPEWKAQNAIDLATQVFYNSPHHPDTLLIAGRSVAIALTLAFGVVLAWWTRRRFGSRVALIALALYCFEPNLIAHGHYATTDILLAVTFFLASIAWCEFLCAEPSSQPRRLLLAGAALGLALTAKYSAIALLPIFGLLGLAAVHQRRIGIRNLALSLAAAGAIALAVVAVVYFPETFRWLTLRQPAHPFVTGLAQLLHKSQSAGHKSYLLGQYSQTGWWYYFPVVFAVKTPLGLLALLAIGLAGLAWRPPKEWGGRSPFVVRPTPRPCEIPMPWLAMAVPAAVFFALSMMNAVNIGLRHILPVYPMLCVLAPALVLRLPRGTAIATVCAGVLVIESVAISPNYLAFFNAAAGGPKAGPRYLLDSNIDWGQDVKKLRSWLRARHIDSVCMFYFGNTGVEFYGIPMKYLPRTWETAEQENLDCVAAISVTNLYDLYVPRGSYAWLRQKEPDARIGWSIYVYDLRRR